MLNKSHAEEKRKKLYQRTSSNYIKSVIRKKVLKAASFFKKPHDIQRYKDENDSSSII